MRTFAVAGTTVQGWHGVRVYQFNNDAWNDITAAWNWSVTPHPLYEVGTVDGGSYWVPASQNAPAAWNATAIFSTDPPGAQPVNPSGKEQRPQGVFIWIPDESLPSNLAPGANTNQVD